jgi:transcriptional regulator with XRE-family HTH domain
MQRSAMVEMFRERLVEVIAKTGLSRSAFARRVGIDRSTLSQILSASANRLPRVETLEAIARSEQISIDWLVGLSEAGGLQPNVVPHRVEIAPGSGSRSDERIAHWYAEAAGYKVRYVPSTIPDLLKLPEVFDYEYSSSVAATPERQQELGEHLLDYQRRPETDMEVCTARQGIEALAHGWGLWRGLAPELRRRQLEQMARITEELYPTFRYFLFDGLTHYSVPVTIFGPQRAAIYIGQMYLVLSSRELIVTLTAHFDELIRHAAVQAHEVWVYLRELASEL